MADSKWTPSLKTRDISLEEAEYEIAQLISKPDYPHNHTLRVKPENDQFRNTLLNHAIGWDDDDKRALSLVKRKDIVDIIDEPDILMRNTPLILAIKRGYIDLAIEIANKSINVNLCDESGNSALHYASVLRENRLIAILLDKGTDISKKNRENVTPGDLYSYEMRAVNIDHFEEIRNIRNLVDENPNPKAKNWFEQTLAQRQLNRKPSLDVRLSCKGSPSDLMLVRGKKLQEDYYRNVAYSLFVRKAPIPQAWQILYEKNLAGLIVALSSIFVGKKQYQDKLKEYNLYPLEALFIKINPKKEEDIIVFARKITLAQLAKQNEEVNSKEFYLKRTSQSIEAKSVHAEIKVTETKDAGLFKMTSI